MKTPTWLQKLFQKKNPSSSTSTTTSNPIKPTLTTAPSSKNLDEMNQEQDQTHHHHHQQQPQQQNKLESDDPNAKFSIQPVLGNTNDPSDLIKNPEHGRHKQLGDTAQDSDPNPPTFSLAPGPVILDNETAKSLKIEDTSTSTTTNNNNNNQK